MFYVEGNTKFSHLNKNFVLILVSGDSPPLDTAMLLRHTLLESQPCHKTILRKKTLGIFRRELLLKGVVYVIVGLVDGIGHG